MAIDDIIQCNKLHIEAAGIETRSYKTWELQYKQILNNELFVVTGKINSELVTFGFFPYNNKYCFYGVSASKRELFDKPLSHAIIWQAIEHAKQIGCKYFELGGHYYKNYDNDIDEKELNIGFFKRGFGGKTKVLFNIFVNK